MEKWESWNYITDFCVNHNADMLLPIRYFTWREGKDGIFRAFWIHHDFYMAKKSSTLLIIPSALNSSGHLDFSSDLIDFIVRSCYAKYKKGDW